MGIDAARVVGQWAQERGFRAAVGPGRILAEVREEIAGRSARGEIDPALTRDYLRWVGEAPDAAPTDGWVAAVAVPHPAALVRFEIGAAGGPSRPPRIWAATIPPTYVNDARLDHRVGKELSGLLGLRESDLFQIRTGLKCLAARLGLIEYGLNNISYISGLGSYFRLVAFAARGPLSEGADSKRGPARVRAGSAAAMEGCESCGLCRDSCPVAAIGGDRFLLRAERCITFYNENPGPWPGWIPRKAHNCIVGCMACQEACPKNRDALRMEDSGVLFDSKETAAMLLQDPERRQEEWGSIHAKLASIGMEGIEAVIGRNLAVLLEAGPRKPPMETPSPDSYTL